MRKIFDLTIPLFCFYLASCTPKNGSNGDCWGPGNVPGCSDFSDENDTVMVLGVSFNPYNPDEFIFLKHNGGHVYKYNMNTGVYTLLYSGTEYPANWGRNGWIIRPAVADSKILKFQEDGSNLTTICTIADGYTHSNWNYSGSRVIFNFAGNNGGVGWMDDNGNVLDTLEQMSVSASIGLPDNSIILPYGTGFQRLQEPGLDLVQIIPVVNRWDYGSIVYDMDYIATTNELIWIAYNTYSSATDNVTHYGGVYKTNLTNLETVTLHKNCNTKTYLDLAVSPDDSKILVSISGEVWTEDCKKIHQTHIYSMNIDGSNETDLHINPF